MEEIKVADTARYVSFYAYDSADHISPADGITGFTVYYYLNNGSVTAMTTPTVTEKDSTNAKGWYTLLVDEAGMVSAEGVTSINIEATGMDPVAIKVKIVGNTTKEVYDRVGAPVGASISADLVVIDNFVDDLESRLTAARAGYLDNLSAGAVALAATALTDVTWTDAKAAFIDHAISTVDTNLDTLLTRITAARAGYLDNLSAGAVALAATALTDVTWTDAKAVFLDHSIATVDGNVDTLLTRITAAVALASDLATAQTDLDTITGTDGVTLATAQALYAPNKVVPDVAGTAATLHGTTDGKIDTVDTNVDSILADTGTDGVLLAATATSAQLVDDTWDELITGSLHNTATSAGRRLLELGAYHISSGTAQAGSAHSITLDAGETAGDHILNRNLIVIQAGTGAGQTRTIVDYNSTSKVAVIDRDWVTNPDATSEYSIIPDDTPLVANHGVATAGTSTTITISTTASAINDTYVNSIIQIMAGTGAGQSQVISGYNGTTKVITVCMTWITTPDNTSVYVILPYGVTNVCNISTEALALINTECDTALTDYDPPTRTEATADKDAIITEVNDNETKIDALNDITVADIIAGVADGSYDLQEMMRLIFSACCAKVSGGGTTTLTFRDGPDTKNRIVETVTSSGDRTVVTLDGT